MTPAAPERDPLDREPIVAGPPPRPESTWRRALRVALCLGGFLLLCDAAILDVSLTGRLHGGPGFSGKELAPGVYQLTFTTPLRYPPHVTAQTWTETEATVAAVTRTTAVIHVTSTDGVLVYEDTSVAIRGSAWLSLEAIKRRAIHLFLHGELGG